MLTKAQLVPVLSFAVTLVVAQALKLQMLNALSLSGFNKSWQLATVGLLAGAVVNTLFTSKVLKNIEASGKFSKDNMVLVADILNTLVLLTVQQAVISNSEGGLAFPASWVRMVFLVISGVVLYDVIVDPLVPEGKYKNSVVNILKKTAAIAASDYMSDLQFNDFNVEAGSIAAGIFVGDLSATPIANALNA